MLRLNAGDAHSLLLVDLWNAGWRDELFPSSGRQAAMSSLAKSFMKKFHGDETDDVRNGLALDLFIKNNEMCHNYGTLEPRNLMQELIVGELKSALYDFFNPTPGVVAARGKRGFSCYREREPLLLNLSDIATHFGVGGGSNMETESGDFYTKFANSSMSTTNDLLPILYRQAVDKDPLLASVEYYRRERYGYTSVSGNSLFFVPKNAKITRVACKEPLLNMIFQKGIGGVIEERLLEVFNIDLSKQPDRNAAMAHVGSVRGDFGTIDLSSASDTISLSLLRQILPQQVMYWLARTRSPVVTLPGDSGELNLHMVSSMGNGFTFPLQTAIFACVLKAVYKVMGVPFIPSTVNRTDWETYDPVKGSSGKTVSENNGTFSVFGDDIIVDWRVYDVTVGMLELLGFTVNREKSFNIGLFRESCGHDYSDGYDIRGVYLQTLNDDAAYYSAINRLNRWSARHGVLLPLVVGGLIKSVSFNAVPYDESDDAGIKIPLELFFSRKYDKNGAVKYRSHVYETPKAVVGQVAGHELGARIPSAQWLLFDYDWESQGASAKNRRKQDKHLRTEHEMGDLLSHFVYHPDGLLLSLLAGSLRNGCLTPRINGAKKVVHKWRVCPCWDSSIIDPMETPGYRSAWISTVVGNFPS